MVKYITLCYIMLCHDYVMLAPLAAYIKDNQFVPPVLAKWLRPHQREGVQFMYECVMGMRSFNGNGCILADDMGLGKTLQSVALLYTLIKTGITSNKAPTVRRIIVACPCSLGKPTSPLTMLYYTITDKYIHQTLLLYSFQQPSHKHFCIFYFCVRV